MIKKLIRTCMVPVFFILILSGCVPHIYEGTTYGIDEFIADSSFIASGQLINLQSNDGCNNDDASLNIDPILDFQDLIIEGDILFVQLYYPERPDHVQAFNLINDQIGFSVSEGSICLPHLGIVEVIGMPLSQAQEKIQQLYFKELKTGQIFVGFKTRKERQVQIIGSGTSMVSIKGGARLSEVLAKADLSPHSNLSRSYLIRNNKRLPIDFYKLIHEGDASQNIILRGGEQIFIAKPDEVSVMVMGEIRKPHIIPIPYGSVALLEALAITKGILFTGDQSHIYVIRGEINRPKIYDLAWEELIRQPNRSGLLMKGDVVVITEKPITQWNRFINQLQPSITCLQSGARVFY